MTVAARVAIAAAEQAQRALGPRAGLTAWRALARARMADADTRARALASALSCAATLRDEASLREFVSEWDGVERGVWSGRITKICKELVRAGLAPHASALAAAEARRHRTALTLYLSASCLEQANAPISRVTAAFRDAAERAANEGALPIRHRAHVRATELLARSWETLPDALAEAARVPAAELEPAMRGRVCRVLLLSPSRFTRAGAIGVLDDLVQASAAVANDATVHHALTTVARWLDDAGGPPSDLELDRLRALFGRDRARRLSPRAREVLDALAERDAAKLDADVATALVAVVKAEPMLGPVAGRARDVASGRFEPQPTRAREERAASYDDVLELAVALRDRDIPRAVAALRPLVDAERDPSRARPPFETLALACMALTHEDDNLRALAIAYFEARLARPRAGTPPGGYLALAGPLANAGREDLATLARHAAVARREPGAADGLGTQLAARGWQLARSAPDSTRRDEAIRLLREAKRVFGAGAPEV